MGYISSTLQLLVENNKGVATYRYGCPNQILRLDISPKTNIGLYWTLFQIFDICTLIKSSPFCSSIFAIYKQMTVVHTPTLQVLHHKSHTTVTNILCLDNIIFMPLF